MFRGNFSQKIDDKGRMSFPAKFREVLEGTGSANIFVTNFKTDGICCLDVYPQQKWLDLEERLRQPGERSLQTLRYFQNYYFPGVQECQLDRQGRIVLCQRLRKYADLRDEAVIAGVMDKLRIFSTERWRAISEAAEQSVDDDPDVYNELGM